MSTAGQTCRCKSALLAIIFQADIYGIFCELFPLSASTLCVRRHNKVHLKLNLNTSYLNPAFQPALPLNFY